MDLINGATRLFSHRIIQYGKETTVTSADVIDVASIDRTLSTGAAIFFLLPTMLQLIKPTVVEQCKNTQTCTYTNTDAES